MIEHNKRKNFLSTIKQGMKYVNDNRCLTPCNHTNCKFSTKIFKILEIQRELFEDDGMYTALIRNVELYDQLKKYLGMYLEALNEDFNKIFGCNTTDKDVLNKVLDDINELGINNVDNVLIDVFGEIPDNVAMNNVDNVLDCVLNGLLNIQNKLSAR